MANYNPATLEVIIASADKEAVESIIKALAQLEFKKFRPTDSGLELIKMFSSTPNAPTQLLIVDQNVKYMPGWLLIKEIKIAEHIRNVPIVFFGREAAPVQPEELVQYGVSKYIKYPTSVSDISFTINSTLQLFYTSGTIENKYSQAKDALIQDKTDKALDIYSELRGLTKKSTRSSIGVMQTHIKDQNMEAAAQILGEIGDEAEVSPSATLIAIRLDLDKKNSEKAKERILRLLKNFPEGFYYIEVSKMLSKYKELEFAAKICKDAIEKNFKFPEFYVCVAKYQYSLNQIDETLTSIKEGETIFGSINDLLNLKGVCLKKKGQFQDAMACYEEALRISPSDSKVYFNLALCSIDMEQYQEAATYLESCLKLSPDFDRAKEKLTELKEKKFI